jgi:N-glycosylase/DNA lyase
MRYPILPELMRRKHACSRLVLQNVALVAPPCPIALAHRAGNIFAVDSSCCLSWTAGAFLPQATLHMTHGHQSPSTPRRFVAGNLPPRRPKSKHKSTLSSPVRFHAKRPSLSMMSSPCSSSSTTELEVKAEDTNDDCKWMNLNVEDGYLDLELTLFGGQSFRWRFLGVVHWRGKDYREYAGVVRRAIVVLRQLSQEQVPPTPDATIWFCVHGGMEDPCTVRDVVRDYFRADTDLRPIVEHFANRDDRFRVVFRHFSGARMLRQEPVECLFAFICSSNNNVKRITGMVTHLAEQYGEALGTYGSHQFYAFPSIDALALSASEEGLRNAGFGYRAKYIVRSAARLQTLGGEKYLLSLRDKSRQDVARSLVELDGIGRKVAGCVALMALDCSDEIPCDTHVWQLAKRDYLPNLRAKSLTDRIYTQVGDHFRELFGEYAGWAHNYLFIAELSDFKQRLPLAVGRDLARSLHSSSEISEISAKNATVDASDTLNSN